MNKMKKYLLIDTETTNSMTDALCYNVAGKVIDAHGGVYEEGNFLNLDVYAMPDLMASAYYKHKMPLYDAQLAEGEIVGTNWYNIMVWVRKMCREYNVVAIIAHNARFDYDAINTTQRYETSSKYRYPLPYGVEIWDTMRMAHDTICQQKGYRKFCEENGFMTAHKTPRPRETAEVIYRYLTKNVEFEEEHRAMEDVEIECEIFWACIRQHKKMRRNCFGEG